MKITCTLKSNIGKVRSREIYDPVLTFRLSNDFHVRRAMKSYLPDNEESIHCATLIQWGNIRYQPPVQEFNTDCAKIGILICYGVEFHEFSRIMADQGCKYLLFLSLQIPRNGHSRVRICVQAHAIENECFIAIAGSVGNFPRVHNMDIQYAQSGIFTPCDFVFPYQRAP